MRMLLPTTLAIAIAASLAAPVAHGRESIRTVEVSKSGALRIMLGRALMKGDGAFCQQNPEVAFLYTEVASGAANARVDEPAGTVSANFDVALDAMCLAGSTTVRLNYGILQGGTATEGEDFTVGSPNPAFVTFVDVPEGGSASGTAALPITIIDDSEFESDETILTGNLGGAYINTPPGGAPRAVPITSLGTPLATLTIDDDDDLTNIGALAGDIIGDDPVARSVADALTPICNAPGQDPALIVQCRAIRQGIADGDADGVRAALRGIAPEEILTQSATVVELGGGQLDNVGQRLSALRMARAAASDDQSLALDVNLGGVPVSSLVSSVLRAADGNDDGSAPFWAGSPWGLFASVTLGSGDRDATNRASGFDHDRSEVSVGVDYRFNDAFVGGGAVGWTSVEADLDAAGGKVDSDAWSVLAYGSYANASGTFVDGIVGWSRIDFEQDRRIAFAVGGTAVDQTARSQTDADQFSADVTVGHMFNAGAWVFTPSGSLRWLSTSIDGFAETGAGEFNLGVDGQDIDSLLASATFHVARNISTSNGILIPYGSVSWNIETEDGADAIGARLLADVSQTRFVVTGDSRDSSYGEFDLGLSFVLAGGFQGYINYTRIFGLDFFDDQSLTVGGRWEF